ncbi:unnamed protein product [Ixodes hexagonus]
MVQKYQSPVRVYKYPFELVMAAYERRFPTCPMIPVFLGSDTVAEFKSEDGAVHVIERRCRLNVDAPYLLKKIIGVDFVYFIQKNSLDRRARVLKIDAHNESFSSRVGINENCTYSVHPENPEWTCFEQSASLDVKSFFGFESAVEKLAMKQYSQNISKGKEIIEYYINELLKEGITYLPPFQEKDGSGDADRPAIEAVAVRRKSGGEKVAPPSAATAAEALSAQGLQPLFKLVFFVGGGGAYSREADGVRLRTKQWNGRTRASRGERRGARCWAESELAGVRSAYKLVWKKLKEDPLVDPWETQPLQPGCCRGAMDCCSDISSRRVRSFIQPVSRVSRVSVLQSHGAHVSARDHGTVVRVERVVGPSLQRVISRYHVARTASDVTFFFFFYGSRALRGASLNGERPTEGSDAAKPPSRRPSRERRCRRRNGGCRQPGFAPHCEKASVVCVCSHVSVSRVVADGRPMYVLRLGQVDMKGFIKSIGEQGLVKLTLHLCEEGLKRTEEATLKTGKPISSWTCLLDLEGLNMRHLWRPGMRALLHIIEMMEANYPETMGRCLVVRAPRVFPILWALVGTFINDNTRSKFTFFADGNHTPTGLAEFLDPAHVPDFLGGPCQTSIPDGGLIPKNLYMSEEDYEREKADGMHLFDDTMYHSVSLARGQVHEVVVNVSDQGSVICWDFDIMKEDVAFAVHHTTRELPPPKAEARDGEEDNDAEEEPVGCAHSPLPLAMLTLDPPPSVLPKSWVAGVDYRTVEPSITCHDGESVQGSHVTSVAGTYILQWRHLEGPQHHSFEFPLAPHKAKVMYYYELLKSHDYRGSMTSLQSSQSGNTCNSSGDHSSALSSCPSR